MYLYAGVRCNFLILPCVALPAVSKRSASTGGAELRWLRPFDRLRAGCGELAFKCWIPDNSDFVVISGMTKVGRLDFTDHRSPITVFSPIPPYSHTPIPVFPLVPSPPPVLTPFQKLSLSTAATISSINPGTIPSTSSHAGSGSGISSAASPSALSTTRANVSTISLSFSSS